MMRGSIEVMKHVMVVVKVAVVVLILCAGAGTSHAREGSKHWRHDRGRAGTVRSDGTSHRHHKPPPKGHHHAPPPPPLSPPVPAPTVLPPVPAPGPVLVPAMPPSAHENSTVFNVLDFGAMGDGISDDSKVRFQD